MAFAFENGYFQRHFAILYGPDGFRIDFYSKTSGKEGVLQELVEEQMKRVGHDLVKVEMEIKDILDGEGQILTVDVAFAYTLDPESCEKLGDVMIESLVQGTERAGLEVIDEEESAGPDEN